MCIAIVPPTNFLNMYGRVSSRLLRRLPEENLNSKSSMKQAIIYVLFLI
jgi:hypothetical protein